MADQDSTVTKNKNKLSKEQKQYLRFGAMIATSMVVMHVVTYVNTYQFSHVELSETRFFMTLLMGSTMAVVMLGFMLGMYKNAKINFGIVLGSILMFALGTFLVRSQNTVDDSSYMNAMIPHHSIAILTSENSEIKDKRVCELAVEIIEAQRREINEMQWLIDDIAKNGYAFTEEQAQQRAAPDFEGSSIRQCEG
ncbi:TPA: DUF305 domain-containing protein [Candidatus Saccharibacteria bacterium]|nr:DUF305 domain-containing protein [Candidatus Saccharibacteria bacterium]HIO87524.1 DUF305 domain-containing protein [Candidatus Saccharibacteria bacterium]